MNRQGISRAASIAAVIAFSIGSSAFASDPESACQPTNCTQQSPVDITGAIAAKLEPLVIDYSAGDFLVYNDGHTIKVLPPKNAIMTLRIGTTVYALKQFHFHHESEHTIDRVAKPMEVHFVNENAGGAAVIGVFLDSSGKNAAFNAIMRVAPQQIGPEHAVPVHIDPNRLLPPRDHRRYWTYMGSLTTPPFDEVVRWLVLRTPVAVSDGDIEKFKTFYENDARPVRPIERRFILSSP
ncbi:MAG TPA: carbonic anhydrase family protein [Rhizomicrobium sp.]